MEKRLQTSLVKFCISLLAILLHVPALSFAQYPSQKDMIRIQIWSELDAFPGKFDDENSGENEGTESNAANQNADNDSTGQKDSSQGDSERKNAAGNKKFVDSAEARDISIFEFAIKRAKEISPYLLNGMLNGWEFEYVPYDKTRRVAEYFSLTEVEPFNPSVNKISYKEPMPVEDRLVCWVECERTEVQKLSYERWKSITHPRVKGHGTAPVEDGFKGIQAACEAAVKNAVREYWRTMVKNKPKEINGAGLVRNFPTLGISSGRYVINLDFFLECGKIIEYSVY